jgi:hypothetical protein
MKKLLLSISMLIAFNSFSQQLQNEDFESLSLGDISTQNGWSTFNGAAADFQVVSDNGGQVAEVTSDPANTLFLWQDGLDTAWAGRTSGNDIISTTFELNSGGVSTSDSEMYFSVYNSVFDNLGGFAYNPTTKVLQGLGRDDDGTGTATDLLYGFALGAGGTDLVLPDNSWSTLVFEFDTVSQEYSWSGPGFSGTYPSAAAFANGKDITEIDFIVFAHTTVSANFRVDNYSSQAKSSSLSVSEFVNNKFSVYPNPTNSSDVVNFSGDNIDANGVTIFNLLGKKVIIASQSELANKQINISSLAKGMYLLKIKTKDGVATKKIVKN